MSEKKPVQKKKMLITAILAILREHTDAKKHIRQAPIMKLLEEEHQLTATRKSVRKNLGDLQEAGFPVKFRKGWYFEPVMSDAEMDYLRACVMGSDLPADKRMSLLDRLASLGSSFYQPNTETLSILPVSPEFIGILNALHDAIAKGHQISFRLKEEEPDDDQPRRKASPYRLETREGSCYLVCRIGDDEALTEVLVENIESVRILKPLVKPLEEAQE